MFSSLKISSGTGKTQTDLLMPIQFKGDMDENGVDTGELSNPGQDEEDYSKFHQAFLETEEMSKGKGVSDVTIESGLWKHNGSIMYAENEISKYDYGLRENDHEEEAAISGFFRGSSVGSDLLIAQLQEASESFEDMENAVQIKQMVSEAILKGIVRALEMDSSEMVKAKEAELQRVKEQVQEKDTIVTRLISTLQSKEDELVKLVEEGCEKERRLVMDMLMERERVVEKVKETEKFVLSKEKEILKMAEGMVELAMKLDEECKRASWLEKQLKESKEAEVLKGKEMMEMMEKSEKFQSQTDSMVEMVRREARLKELRWAESSEEKDKLLSDQLHKIAVLESAEQELKEKLCVQSEEVARLVRSGKDSSELLAKLTIENKNAAEGLDARDRNLRSLQDDLEFLKNRVQELMTDKSELVEELNSHKMELGANKDQLVKQKDALQEAELRMQTFVLSEKHLLQETAKLSLTLQEYVDAAQSLKMEIEDQNWKHEYQTGLIMETVNGKVLDLAKEISTLGEALKEKQGDTITFEPKVLQQNHAELISLQSSKEALERKIEGFHAVMKSFDHGIEEKDKTLEDKVQMLKQAEDAISHLEEKHIQKKALLQNYKKEAQEIRSEGERMKNQQKVLEENNQMLREAEDKISYLDKELGLKEVLIQKYKNGIEEKAWRVEFEEQFLNTFVKNSFGEFLEQVAEIQRTLVNVGEKLVCGQNELQAARVELGKSKAEVESLKSDIVASSELVDQLRTEVKMYVMELAQSRAELQESLSELEKGNIEFSEGQKQMDGLRKELEESLSKKRDEVREVLDKVEETEWKSQAQTMIVLGLLEISTQEKTQEFFQLREDIRLRQQEVLSLRCEVEEQQQKLNVYVFEVTDLKIALSSKDEELCAFRQEAQLGVAMHLDALGQAQSLVRKSSKEIEDLQKLKETLVERIQEEKHKVQQLEDALVEQKWKNQAELDMVRVVFWQGGIDNAITWSNERAFLVTEVVQLRQELGQKQNNDKVESPKQVFPDVSNVNDVVLESHLVPSQGKFEEAKSETHEGVEKFSPGPDSILLLERENTELRREKEKLLEQKTEEIYKLKREFYKELEKVKGKGKNDNELGCLKCGLSHEGETSWEIKGSSKEKNVTDDQKGGSETKGGWDSEKSTLLESISQRDGRIKERDEQIKDVSNRLFHALEKEKNHVSTRASLVENLAALEKERNRLNSVHEREKEKLTAFYKRLLEDMEAKLINAVKDMELKSRQIVELEGESCLSKDEIVFLRMEMKTIRKLLETELAGQIQGLVASSQHLASEIAERTKQYSLRLEGAEGLVKCLLRQFSMLSMNESDYLQNVHNLQKAEAEVDLLGDEVDALMDILEKVYGVLNHYAPVIQHYPGLAELVKVVRQEVLQRIYESKDV